MTVTHRTQPATEIAAGFRGQRIRKTGYPDATARSCASELDASTPSKNTPTSKAQRRR